MSRSFLKGSAVFAASTMLFSLIRQIIFFPTLANSNETAFAYTSYAIFGMEALAYTISGTIPDYFVRRAGRLIHVRSIVSNLIFLCLISIIALPIFLLLKIKPIDSILLTVNILFFTINALLIKIIFNELDFGENIYCMAYRSTPYLIFFVYIKTAGDKNIAEINPTFLLALIFTFEFFYFIRLKLDSRIKNNINKKFSKKYIKMLFYSISPFIFGYLVAGISQRGEYIFIKNYAELYYIEYAKNILVINFFCGPIVLILSSPLMSYLHNKKIDFKSPKMISVITATTIFALLISAIAANMHEIIYLYLYKSRTDFSFFYTSIISFSLIMYSINRTLLVKYCEPKYILASSGISILVLLVTLKTISANNSVTLFHGSKFLFSFIFIIKEWMKNQPSSKN